MAHYIKEVSRTFGEYLLIPSLTTKECTPDNVSLKTPVVKFRRGETSKIQLNIPFVSAVMQAVSDDGLAIALARNGGLSFIFGSQPIEDQAEMVRRVKKFKAGFVVSDSNLRPDSNFTGCNLSEKQTGHSSIAITDDGTPNGKLLGMVTSRDYRLKTDSLDKPVSEFMTPFDNLIVGKLGLTLSEANTIIWEHKLNCLPVIDEHQKLQYFVFRKDYDNHMENPYELLDSHKKLMVGAGINSRDYKERVPALVEAGVDVIDCAISPFAMGTSQPATEVMVETFKGTPYDTGYDQNILAEIADYFRPYRDKCLADGLLNPKVMGVDIKTLLYQVPGGMLSNMVSQLKEQNAEDKYYDVLREIPQVRKDLGEPPLVTPSSQIVGTQAVFNVLMGERYKMATKETKAVLRGEYGQTVKPMNQEIMIRLFPARRESPAVLRI